MVEWAQKGGTVMPSVFTRIINREIPAHIVYEDDIVICFLDISQATPGHTLVVTKTPYETFFDLPEDVSSHVFKVAVDLAGAIRKAFSPEGMNMLSNAGEIAGQSVFHFHLHLIPRYQGDGVSMRFENNMGKIGADILEERKNRIIAARS
jgi:histidine triad (HIT) family protein